MLSPILPDIIRAHQAELLRQAEQHNEATLGNPPSAPLHAAVLNKVGQQLVEWGHTLQSRYGDLLEEAQQVNRPNSSSTVGL
jgi:hypothetical protein